ncbi:hypothetical protein RB614_37630 [Phytohabitans sp. ZYX-F-186]|uniref:Streptomyces killer toxin-like beta/gamma crystallin domain-containing protein n=1 Tax=Phytohabitans maris TaxID=3071409 RepID=A0ABU0ZT71_9ACTN|nr:hypothetical protein [Phytohabitans sp. ZYX-F-186]MDQ7910230.1 hypothetical protein [Phytohabitans sp. ZYX-F-186]
MKMRKLGPMLVVSALTTAGLVGLSPGSALAAPTDCTISFNGNPRTVQSYCAGGTGEHRIHIVLRHFLPEVGLIPVEGNWAPVGGVSITGYPPHTIENVWIEKRG